MPRYLIERQLNDDTEWDAAAMQALGVRSKHVGADLCADFRWEHSHVCMDESGTIRTFCVYTSPDEQLLRDHAARVGQHVVLQIHALGGDISPEDFPG